MRAGNARRARSDSNERVIAPFLFRRGGGVLSKDHRRYGARAPTQDIGDAKRTSRSQRSVHGQLGLECADDALFWSEEIFRIYGL